MTEDPKITGGEATHGHNAAHADGAEEARGSIPKSAFYSPDDPIARPEGEIPRDALFSPDDPLKRGEPEDGVVTGLNGNLTWSPDFPPSLVWKLRHAADLMERLARELREQGLGALKVNPESSPVDALLRSFVGGYLVGKMEDEG